LADTNIPLFDEQNQIEISQTAYNKDFGYVMEAKKELHHISVILFIFAGISAFLMIVVGILYLKSWKHLDTDEEDETLLP